MREEIQPMKKWIVRVSKDYRITLPGEVREDLKIRPGQELFMYIVEGSLRISLQRSVRELRGIAKGMKWKRSDRDRTDRF